MPGVKGNKVADVIVADIIVVKIKKTCPIGHIYYQIERIKLQHPLISTP